MQQITNVGQLRAAIEGLSDDTVVRMPAFGWSAPQPGVYVVRFAAGTCNPPYVEVFVQPDAFGGVHVVYEPHRVVSTAP